ncbi:hypothetical protein MKZ38_007751 [Zalerion maritima]|uniref:Uncharacterized protein n=1 Tax=Zalerion maritima TaxID=339359 RepID=A0AAD5WVE0_9PEZI|nr:hypothetical protein MKZ38_007751 [Zalerion maritima]
MPRKCKPMAYALRIEQQRIHQVLVHIGADVERFAAAKQEGDYNTGNPSAFLKLEMWFKETLNGPSFVLLSNKVEARNSLVRTASRRNGAKSRTCNEFRILALKLDDELEIRLREMATPSGLPGEKEMDSIKQCLAICTRASEQATQHRTVSVEDVSSADDGQQVIVATLGDLISVKHVKAGG